MSADRCIAYFGLRFELDFEEVEGLELRSDPRVVSARGMGLRYYFGNFGGLEEVYLLFIGDQLGIFGPENLESSEISSEELLELMAKTKKKLVEAGLEGAPSFHFQWEPDV